MSGLSWTDERAADGRTSRWWAAHAATAGLLAVLLTLVGDSAEAALDRDRGPVSLGTAVDPAHLTRESGPYATTLLAHYDRVTPENALKMEPLRPAPGTYDFREADELVAFAERHGLAVHGHTLVWHRQIPDWVLDRSWTREELLVVLEDHVRTVVGRYRGRVASWDVVNEPLGHEGRGLRPSLWERVIGPEYIELALRWAHEADPGARLFVNEYGAELPGVKADAYRSLVAGLVERDVPLHGVGFQAHLRQHDAPADLEQQLLGTLRQFASLQLRTDITELDVAQTRQPGGRSLVEQADVYRAVAVACRRADSCRALSTWGFTDRHTWLAGTDYAPDPLPFDTAYRPKPALAALLGGLGGRIARPGRP